MRAMNLTVGLMSLVGAVCCVVSLNNDVLDLIGRVCGEPGQVVAAAGLAVCCVFNSLTAGHLIPKSIFGTDSEQYLV